MSVSRIYRKTRSLLQQKKVLFVLGSILVLGSIVRVYNISHHDAYTDEVLYGFRAIGMIDYVAAAHQTTPWQWFESVPAWAHLSFHDHPPLFFLVQHVTIGIFGETLFALRLPAIVFGVASVLLCFLIGKELFDKRVGVVASLLLAVQSYHVWVSRVGIQDGMAIFMILLTLLLYLWAYQHTDRWRWLVWGGVFGLALLTKYSTGIVLPMIFLHGIVYGYTRQQKICMLWSALAACIFFSPVLIYNALLFKTTGHFDFQFSAFLGQDVQEWAVRTGRSQTGNVGDKFLNFFRAMYQSNSIIFNSLTALAYGYMLIYKVRFKFKAHIFLLLSSVLMWMWFLVIGSTYRFVVMIIPFCVLTIAVSYVELWKRRTLRVVVGIVGACILLFELLFATNSFLMRTPALAHSFSQAQVREEVQYVGFRDIDAYLDHVLSGRMSAFSGEWKHQFQRDLQDNAIEEYERINATRYPLLIIYDSGINSIARLWLFHRRALYHGWLFMSDREFLALTGDQKEKFFRVQGIHDFLYITGADSKLSDMAFLYTPHVVNSWNQEMKQYLESNKNVPIEIPTQLGMPAFVAYWF